MPARVVTATASVSQSTCTVAISSRLRTRRWLRSQPMASASGAAPSVIRVTISRLSTYSVSGCSPAIEVGTVSPRSFTAGMSMVSGRLAWLSRGRSGGVIGAGPGKREQAIVAASVAADGRRAASTGSWSSSRGRSSIPARRGASIRPWPSGFDPALGPRRGAPPALAARRCARGCPRRRVPRRRRRKLVAALLGYASPCFSRDALRLGAPEVGSPRRGPKASRFPRHS